MSQDDLFGAPAGWYPDPLGLPQLRWWNNHAWTEQTSAARQPMVVQDTKFAWADDELPSRREERERERQNADRKPAATAQPTAEILRELEPPRALTKIQENRGAPAAPTMATEAPFTAAPQQQAAQQPNAPQQPAAQQPAAAQQPFAAQQPTAQQPTAAQQPAAAQQQPFATSAPQQTAPDAAAAAAAAARSAEALFSAAPASAATPAATAPAASAPVDPAAAFGSLFDGAARTTAAPAAAPAAGSLDDLFGAETAAPRGQKRTAPILPQAPIQSARGASNASSTSTAPVWLIAMIPLFQLVLSLLFLTAFSLGSYSALFIAILFVPYLIVVALAYFDHRALVNAGHDRPAHWAFAFATAPVYLLLRARSSIRETGHGIGPVLVWAGLGLLHIVSFVAVPGLLIALLPAVFSGQIEDSIQRDAALIGGADITATCPATPPLLPGQEIVCEGINSTGNRTSITVALDRVNGWIDFPVRDWGVYGTPTTAAGE